MSNSTPLSLLLIEDDVRLAQLTAEYLRKNECLVTWVARGDAGLDEARRGRFDLVLLDLMLPGLSGLEVCRELRRLSNVPILIMSARGEEADRILGLELGADDYQVKPYSPRELLARIHAILRRVRSRSAPATHLIHVGPLQIDPASYQVHLHDQAISLTGYEFLLLKALAERAGRVCSRELLMEEALGNAEDSFDRSIDVHISRLRQKLGDDPKQPRLIKTVRGAGYLLALTGGGNT